GAFGSLGGTTSRTALIALAAKRVNRPVRLVATRAQGFTIATFRAETRHHVKLAATRQGKLQSVAHEGWEVTSRPANYSVSGTEATARLYASPNVATKVTIVHADRNTPGFMRAPPETPYAFALESAMDELAAALGMDPIELRRRNDTDREPIKGLPYTSRSLVHCLDEGARAFGWQRRDPRPGDRQRHAARGTRSGRLGSNRRHAPRTRRCDNADYRCDGPARRRSGRGLCRAQSARRAAGRRAEGAAGPAGGGGRRARRPHP